MDLGFLFGSLLTGGSQTQSIGLMEALKQRHNIKYAVLGEGPVDQLILESLRRFENVSPSELREWAKVIHFDGTGDRQRAIRYLSPIAHRTVWFHGSFPKKGLREKIIGRKELREATHVSVSEHVAKRLPVPSKVIFYADFDVTKPLPNVPKVFDVAILGRIRPIKNHDLFMDIVREGNFSFLVVGGSARSSEGHMNLKERELRELARPGIDSVTGMVEQYRVPSLLQQAKVVVVTSHNEGLGAGLEAMACGLPVVARRVGGTSEIYPDDARWLSVAKRAKAAKYVDAINRAIREVGLGARLREHVSQKYSKEGAVSAYEKLFLQLGSK